MENQILIALKNNKLLKNILFTELDLSAIKGNLLTLSEGEILYREGDKSEYLYLIVSGEMNVIRKKGSRRTLSEIFTDHDFFGSDEFIQSVERKSTAVALRDSYIIALLKSEVDSLIEQDDEILTNLYESLHHEEEETDINAPVEKIDFKKTGKQESSFADRVSKPKENIDHGDSVPIGALDESTPDESLESDSEIPKEREEEITIPEDKFEDAFTGVSKSFSKVEPKETDETPKSFKDKIEISEKNSDVNDVEQVTFEPGENEQAAGDAEVSKPDTDDEPNDTEENFPTTFEINYSVADNETAPESDLDSPISSESFTGLQDEEVSDEGIPEKERQTFDGESYEDTTTDFANVDTEEPQPGDIIDDTEPVSNEEAPVSTVTENETDTEQDSKELEDFYASMSDSSETADTAPLSQEPSDEDPPAGLDDYNPFPEETKDEQPEPHEYTIGDEYKPEEDLTGSFPQDETEEDKQGESDLTNTEDEITSMDSFEDTGNLDSETESGFEKPVEEEPDVELTGDDNKETVIEQPPKSSDYDEAEQSIDMLEKINKAAQIVNSNIQIDDVFKSIVDVAQELTNADRGTLYLVDRKKNELWSKVAVGNEFKEIKLAMGEGLAGWVAQKGEVINLEDVSRDPRFNSSFDKSSGYETKTMLCFPIKNKNEEIVGVLQLINSKKGKFSKLDEEFLGALSVHAAMALQNADLVEQLLTGERVSSLGKMANFLLQDIKKPIMVSKRYAEHLKSKVLEEDVGRVVDMLLDQLNHIADLVQSTSSYSEGQIVLRSMLCKLNETLDDYITRVDSIFRSGNCQIVKEYDNEINVKISPKQMFQCFQHLIKNACDAMPDGGTIQLSTKIEKETVHIIVKDTGLGIPESLHDKIFEPFMSHGKKEGTGLGLSITKKIIEEHGGKIGVQSEMGEGATFTISLPIVYGM